MGEFRMPSLGADMDAGTIVEWKVAPGDVVHRGDVVAVVDTDKADIDAEIFEDGRIEALLVDVGVKVPVGTVLATLAAVDAPVVTAPMVIAPVAVAPVVAEPVVTAPVKPALPPPVLSPLVRHLAERNGVDVTTLHGSGPGHRITRSDVEAAVHATPVRPPSRSHIVSRPRVSPRARRLAATRGIDLRDLIAKAATVTGRDVEAFSPAPHREDRSEAMQRRIAVAMARSNRDIPHYYVSYDCDLSNTQAWLTAYNEQRPPNERILPAAVLLAATARAAADVDGFNGWWRDDAFQPAGPVDLAFIVSLRSGGLLAPVIPRADTLTVPEVMAQMHDLVTRSRTGHLRSSDVADASITVTNLGDQGGDSVAGVIYPPQVALVGFGRVRERPWVVDGALDVRPVVTITVAGDHRVSEGHGASRFIARLVRSLQSPESLERTSP